MQELVKYHNDFNFIAFPNFHEQEYNILMNVIYKLQNKGDEIVTFTSDEVVKFFGSSYNKSLCAWMLKGMADKITSKTLSFTKVLENGNNLYKTFSLMPTFEVETEPNPNNAHDEMLKENLISLTVQINKEFIYLLNKIKGNFTRFELAEFIDLSGKYAKTLYRLLKQYRQTGYFRINWDEFAKILDIPKNYRMVEIDKRILKPAIKELTKPRNLLDMKRIPFENLTYNKIKGKGRGRGGNVIGIEFTFKPQKDNHGILPKDETIKNLRQENGELITENFNQNMKISKLEQENKELKESNEELVLAASGNSYASYYGFRFYATNNYNKTPEVVEVAKITNIKNSSDQNTMMIHFENVTKNTEYSLAMKNFRQLGNYIAKYQGDYKSHNIKLAKHRKLEIFSDYLSE